MKKILGVLAIFTILVVGAGVLYIYQFAATPVTTEKLTFELAKGARPYEVSMGLERAGIIQSGRMFYTLGKITGKWKGLRAGEYEIPSGATPAQIFKILKSGVGIQYPLLVREGDNIYQVAQAMEQARFGRYRDILMLLKSPALIESVGLAGEGVSSLEGYLFPNTYFYDKKENAESMIKKMVQAFLKNWNEEFDRRAQELNMSRKEVVTLASMIEKETGAGEERPVISSVFHNRLKKRMRLQSDPTTIYGMWEKYAGNIHRSDLLRPTPYNTYTVSALPIGPISNPHHLSVKAALYPESTDYLFFVSKNDGTHVFTSTYAEHSAWVKRLQVDPSAREGKSWRDLSKRKN